MSRIIDYAKLMRLHRPIGIYLVLWPTLWALWLCANGLPELNILAIFIAGVVVMRSAGCVINDYADRNIDGRVKRTKDRPLATGRLCAADALRLFILLCLVALWLVLQTNTLALYLSVPALLLASIYPFMKRHTHLPQVVLGAAFACSVPMAFAAQGGTLDDRIWIIYTTVVIWTVTYDTFYAMADRADDIKVGVKSTAILFADADRLITAVLQLITLFALVIVGQRFELGEVYFASLMVVATLFCYQQYLIRHRKPSLCFRAFLNNNWVGIAIFAGIAGDIASRSVR